MAFSIWNSLVEAADRGDTFHVVDTETTGLSPTGDRVIEIATVTLRGGKIVDRFETLVNPGIPVPARITELTGINTAMLTPAPYPAEALAQWHRYLGKQRGGHFVAHNASFDWDFLREEHLRLELEWPFKKKFCTVQLARHVLPGLRRYRLDNLIAHYGIRIGGDRHRALADVEATAEAFLRMIDELRGGPAPAVAEPAAPASPGAADAWDQVLGWVRGHSVTTAAMLAQHAVLDGPGADGAVVLKLTPVYQERLSREQPKRALVEAAVAAVYGPQASLRLETR